MKDKKLIKKLDKIMKDYIDSEKEYKSVIISKEANVIVEKGRYCSKDCRYFHTDSESKGAYCILFGVHLSKKWKRFLATKPCQDAK